MGFVWDCWVSGAGYLVESSYIIEEALWYPSARFGFCSFIHLTLLNSRIIGKGQASLLYGYLATKYFCGAADFWATFMSHISSIKAKSFLFGHVKVMSPSLWEPHDMPSICRV